MDKRRIRQPVVWMNVTTSSTWTRPPVGVVRVERALSEELALLLGDSLKRCIWADGRFVEYQPPRVAAEPALAGSAPDIASIDSIAAARRWVGEAFAALDFDGVNPALPAAETSASSGPSAGDFLISVGLDWSQPYTEKFFEISRSLGVKVITCCYDLIPVLFPQYCAGDVSQHYKEYFYRLCWGSSAILCISEQSKRDLLDLHQSMGLPPRATRVIPLGDHIPGEEGGIKPLIWSISEEPFILFVSTIERRKNHEVLCRAYHLLARQGRRSSLPKLVFAGMQGWGVGDFLKNIASDPLLDGLIVQLHEVTDAELSLLYRRSLFCVFPSLYEGWGLPVGEALALGKAVIASSEGSLPEVGGNLVRYVDPWHPQGWADAMWELISKPEVVRGMEEDCRLNYARRTWSDTALAVNDLVMDLVGHEEDAQVLLPGYDMSSEVGLHVGPSIRATSAPGYLVFGPHRAAAAGDYRVCIWTVENESSAGVLEVDFASSDGRIIHGTGQIQISGSANGISTPTELLVTIMSNVIDFEIRCYLRSALSVEITMIEIEKLN